jgi:ribosomal protein S12 methylthiotransferase accessory factor
MELIQRDGNSVNYRAMDRGVAVELDDVRDPETRALLAELDARGVDVIVKLAATDFGMANLYVVGVDRDVTQAPQPITLSACGEAAHPDRERALAKALREFVSSRSRKPFCHGPLAPVAAIAPPGYLDAFQLGALRSEDDRALQAMREWVALDHEQFYEQIRHPILDVRSRVRFSDLPTLEPDTTGNPKYLLDHIARQLAADNLEIIYVNFTPERTDVSALKAIVPGLEVETMTYQRVGRRNIERLLERSSPLVGIGSTPHGAKPIPLRVEDEERIGGPAWFDPAALDQTIGPLYALYREPGRHVIGFTSSSTDE